MNRTYLFAGAAFAALAGTAAPAAQAQDTTYTSQSAFSAAVLPGSYTETFTNTPAKGTEYDFSSGLFSYNVTASNGDLLSNQDLGALSTSSTYDSMIFTFTSPVTAVGGNFYISNTVGAAVTTGRQADVILTLNDGTTKTLTTKGTGTSTFVGFTSLVPITSMTFIGSSSNIPIDPLTGPYSTVDNFTVGLATPLAAAPEPSQAAALLVGVLGLGALALRARKRLA